MDAKEEVERLNTPHLNWFYGPFSKDKKPPAIPNPGDWIIVAVVNYNGDLRFNVGQFLDTGPGEGGDCFRYSLASCSPNDNWEFIAAYALMPRWPHAEFPVGLRQFQAKVTSEIWRWNHYPVSSSKRP
jgi:hypothetical protein